MSLQHIQKNSPRLLPKPAKFEKNPPNGYRVIRKTKCGAGGAGGARCSPIHKQASLAGRLIMLHITKRGQGLLLTGRKQQLCGIIGLTTLQRYPMAQKFRQNRSISQGFRDTSIFVFCNFHEKFEENSKWQPFLARQAFFKNWVNYSAEIPYGSKISSKSLYLAAYLCFAIFVKNSKIQNGSHFWQDKHFLKIGFPTLQRYPMIQKFCRNRSISHSFQGTSIFVFCNFCEKFKMAAIFW